MLFSQLFFDFFVGGQWPGSQWRGATTMRCPKPPRRPQGHSQGLTVICWARRDPGCTQEPPRAFGQAHPWPRTTKCVLYQVHVIEKTTQRRTPLTAAARRAQPPLGVLLYQPPLGVLTRRWACSSAAAWRAQPHLDLSRTERETERES